MIFDDKSKVLQFLQNIGYYSLSGMGSTFETAYNIYKFYILRCGLSILTGEFMIAFLFIIIIMLTCIKYSFFSYPCIIFVTAFCFQLTLVEENSTFRYICYKQVDFGQDKFLLAGFNFRKMKVFIICCIIFSIFVSVGIFQSDQS